MSTLLEERFPMTGISGKVVAVTGASSGIGEATARLLAGRGAAVVLGARRTERLDKLAQEIRDQGGRAISPVAVARAIAFAVEQPYDVEISDITVRPAVQG
jgi:NADP-dependent 3-hydroxy acid dehydrogenase YdfG